MRDDTPWAAAIAGVIVAVGILFLEVFLARWLFGLFGYHFSFFTTFLILVVVDLIFGSMFRSRRK